MATSKGKIIFWVLVAGVTVTGGFLLYKKLSVAKQKAADEVDSQAQADAATKVNSPDAPRLQAEAKAIKTTPDGFPLQMGSTDAKTSGAVSKMQKWIIGQDSSALSVYHADGKFGAETQTWVKKLINTNGTVSQSWYDSNVVNNSAIDTNPPYASNIGADLLKGIIPSGSSGVDGKKSSKKINSYNGRKGKAARKAYRFDIENTENFR